MKPASQIPVFLACMSAAGLASFAFDPATATRFSGYGGGLPAISMLALCILLGLPALWQLQRSEFITSKRRKTRLGQFVALSLAFAAIAITVDLLHPFPETINARVPQSLLFYPAIAMVAETVFRLVPAALVFTFTRHLPATIVIAALTEPAFQLTVGWTGAPHWSDAITALNIFAISLTQLILLRRHGFAAMLGLRLAYYLWWHVLWGEARLALLF